MSETKVILSFDCKNELERDKDNLNYFCQHCQKQVIDFRKQNLDQVKKYLTEHPGTCGIFKGEHTHNYPNAGISELNLKKWIIATLSSLTINLAFGQAEYSSQEKVKTEISPVQLSDSNSIKQTKNQRIKKTKTEKTERVTKLDRKWEYGIFFGRKFPFMFFRRHIYRTSQGNSDFW